MIKKDIYPKTERLKFNQNIQITEKMDGQNTAVFKKNGVVYVASREIIYDAFNDEEKIKLDKILHKWISTYRDFFVENLHEGAVVCGELLGSKMKCYPNCKNVENQFYMFAKANIDDNFKLYNLKYDHALFIYPFISKEIPSFITLVPVVMQAASSKYFEVEELDELYDEYVNQVGRKVEGFVLCHNGHIYKYVRYKNGKFENHHE